MTTSALIVGPRGVVLHRHRLHGIWVAPGGHIDRDENPWDAAVCEATEEPGLAVGHVAGVPSLVHVDVDAGPHGHTHLDLRYLLEGGDAEPAPPPDESQEVAWFSWTEALAITEPCMAGILRQLGCSLTDPTARTLPELQHGEVLQPTAGGVPLDVFDDTAAGHVRPPNAPSSNGRGEVSCR